MASPPEPSSLLSYVDAQYEKDNQRDTRRESYASTTKSGKALDIESQIKGLVRTSAEDDGQMRKLGVMFRDLRLVGLGVSDSVQHNLASLFSPQSILQRIDSIRHPPIRDIISGFEGTVLPGEMLLVLGRPGSGCTTFLKTLANHREDYHAVHGDVFYDSFTSGDIEKRYRGDVIYCPEDDAHFPTLTVGETLQFASTMRAPNHRAENQTRTAYAEHMTDVLLHMFGLDHARHTVVGDASLRGVSGGEKKRVSIAEVLSARGKLVCWDNSTRGLDSSTALEYIRALRAVTDTAKVTTVVSIYQAGEQLYDLFDKVCLIYEGKMAYFGPAREARQYFMDMGYEPQNRQTTPDFLVAVTDPNARLIRPGVQTVVPRTADEMTSYFKGSRHGQLNHSSTDAYERFYVNKPEMKIAYERSATSEHALRAPNRDSYILSIPMQVRAVMRRRWQILRGDWATQAVQFGTQIFQAIFIGTVFYKTSTDTGSYFSLGGVLFFALFCGSITTMSEIPGLFSQRQIVLRHRNGALYYPFIDSLAHTIVDIPITFMQLGVMLVTLYFLVGLQRTVGQFFIFFLFAFMITLTMKSIFRSVAAFSSSESSATAAAGVILMPVVVYTGYAIHQNDIIRALRWITDINPMRYAFESVMVNEFHTINGTCTTLVPSGPGYENVILANQVCTTIGSQPGLTTVPGETYVNISFGYSYSHLWRNLGILAGFTFGFLGILLFITQYNRRTTRDSIVTLYKEGSDPILAKKPVDEEKVVSGDLHDLPDRFGSADKNVLKSEKLANADVFSWKDIQYSVPVSRGEMRKLLDDVSGYVAPGKLTALMGESGAGKTTLLNVLAQRVSVGVVHGDCLVNGRPLPADFQAQTAYVQQLDTHIPETTVREALLFSARIRQPASVPLAEKEVYVDKCLKMCGLEAYADAIVGSLGVEHKKRTSIAVELAAKPKLLLFLDEPTSGLDSQSAWAIVTFLRELADNGQAILCTIHQPSGELFQVFDRLLLLRKGGQTVYFGDIGEKSMTMISYFERNGAPRCVENENPAEYMLDVIGAGATATSPTNWNQVWKKSPEAAELQREIERIHDSGRSRPAITTGTHSEFANSWITQVGLLMQRGYVCYWRNPMYIYSKVAMSIICGLIIGFTFYQSTNSLEGSQDKLFSVFMATVYGLTMVQQLQSMFIESRSVYEIRERPSRMFSWSAFLVSQILIEVPWNMLGGSLVFVCWYWTAGFDTSRAGFSFLLYAIVYPLYFTTFGQAIAAISPSAVIGNTLAGTLFSFIMVFTGVLQRYSSLGWWKWMYHVSPLTYFIEGFLGQAIGNQEVTCASTELVTIIPPSGLNCSAYMDPYISFAGGYVTSPNATTDCQFCQFKTTNELLQLTYNISYGHHWRDLGIILGFCLFNVLCMFAGMYFFRMRRGMGNPLAFLRRRRS